MTAIAAAPAPAFDQPRVSDGRRTRLHAYADATGPATTQVGAPANSARVDHAARDGRSQVHGGAGLATRGIAPRDGASGRVDQSGIGRERYACRTVGGIRSAAAFDRTVVDDGLCWAAPRWLTPLSLPATVVLPPVTVPLTMAWPPPLINMAVPPAVSGATV